LEEFDALGADEEILERLLVRLEHAADQAYELGSHYAFLFSWLVARIGPRMGMSYELFEIEVARSCKLPTPLVMPRWTLSSPMVGALHRRMPCRPFFDGDDQDLVRAYDGLLDHLVFVAALPSESQRLEMLNTAMPWRVVAIADRLEPELSFKDPIATRLQRLKSRTIGGTNSSAIERFWWRSLDGTLCARRHALSHLGGTDGWTFSRCADAPWSMDEARAAAAGIGLALMDSIARSLRETEPPAQAFEAVLVDKQLAWLDTYAGG
jgi:hypothetical protein